MFIVILHDYGYIVCVWLYCMLWLYLVTVPIFSNHVLYHVRRVLGRTVFSSSV